jgi:hypothetical protein
MDCPDDLDAHVPATGNEIIEIEIALEQSVLVLDMDYIGLISVDLVHYLLRVPPIAGPASNNRFFGKYARIQFVLPQFLGKHLDFQAQIGIFNQFLV